MKYLKLSVMSAVLALVTAACGDSGQAFQPDEPQQQAPVQQPRQQVPSGPEPTGPSMVAEFNEAYSAARAAWDAFREDRSPENYALCGARILEAQMYGFEHERNGHDVSTLRNRRALNQLRTDWQKSPPHGTNWEEHPEYQQAKDRYDAIQRG